MTSLTLFRQGFTGITAAALAGSSLLAITSNAQAASLDYDCFSRQTGQLVVKAAVDMTSLDLACLASAEAMLEGQHNPNLNVVYTTQPAPAQTSSSGEAFLGGIVGGVLGGVIQGSMNRGYDAPQQPQQPAQPPQQGISSAGIAAAARIGLRNRVPISANTFNQMRQRNAASQVLKVINSGALRGF